VDIVANMYSCEYVNEEQFARFLRKSGFHPHFFQLVQAHFSEMDFVKWKELQLVLKNLLPNARLIGCASKNGTAEYRCSVVITEFRKITVETGLIENEAAPSAALNIQGKKAILYIGTQGNGKAFCQLEKMARQAGLAASGAVVDGGEQAVFTLDGYTHDGIAYATFSYPQLSAVTVDDFWFKTGIPVSLSCGSDLKVTAIDGKNPFDYLQNGFPRFRSANRISARDSFPLAFRSFKNGKTVPVRRFLEDGTLEMEAELSAGEHMLAVGLFPNEIKDLHILWPEVDCREGRPMRAVVLSEGSDQERLLSYHLDLLKLIENASRKRKVPPDRYRAYFRSIFDHNEDIVFSADLMGNFTAVNRKFVETFGYPEKEILGKPALDYVGPGNIRPVKRHFIRSLRGNEQSYQVELPVADGSRQLFQIRNIPILLGERPIGIIGFGRNITEQKKYEERIVQLAYFDKDTRLPNRQKMTKLIQEKIDRASRKGSRFTVMFIDIDRFKLINDSLGHYIGDQVIRELAERIRSHLPEDVCLGRFGGDKFILLFSGRYSPDDVPEMGKQLLELVSEPFAFDGHEFFLTASAGVSSYPTDGQSVEAILKNADTALNRAKKNGTGGEIQIFCNEMNDQVKYRFELENYLRRAIEKTNYFYVTSPLLTWKRIPSSAVKRSFVGGTRNWD
jgi:PAS domain S-box/diguanylate cyclase (GGDEF) domain